MELPRAMVVYSTVIKVSSPTSLHMVSVCSWYATFNSQYAVNGRAV